MCQTFRFLKTNYIKFTDVYCLQFVYYFEHKKIYFFLKNYTLVCLEKNAIHVLILF